MDRMLTQEERIRRAEEIYNRRRYENREMYSEIPRRKEIKTSSSKVKHKMAKKMITQIIICMLIYFSVYGMQQSNLFASDKIKEKTKEVLNYDIGFEKLQEIYNFCVNTIKSKLVKQEQVQENTEEHSNEPANDVIDENVEVGTTAQVIEEQQEAIGGAEEPAPEETKTQEQLDIEFVKQNINMIWPLNGVKTSGFGTREATEIVTANHRGIDIGGNTGTAIVAAMDGVVTQNSSEGDYGKHLRIENGEVMTLYAHCSKLCVEEGTYVKQGDKIAEVGQTRQSNWPTSSFWNKARWKIYKPRKYIRRKIMQIKIDLKIFLFLLIFVITRQIKIYAILMLFALIHELGHLITGLVLGLKIEEISLIPVGFSIKFKTEIKDYNQKIKKANLVSLKKMIIAIAGPVTNLIIIGIVVIYYKLTQMTTLLKLPVDLIIYSNILIFIFNLLPIYPLDGGRILKELVHIFAGLYKSYIITNNIANIVIIILTIISSIAILIYKNIAILIIIAYLWGMVILENKKFNTKMDIWKKLKN